MADVVLIRPDDLLVLGVRWWGFTVSGGAAPLLTAGPDAHLLILLPPQHVGEESSPRGSDAPLQLSAGDGTTVPAWDGLVSGPTRLGFKVDANTEIPLTAEGVLAAVMKPVLQVAEGVPGVMDTAIELPWRLVIAPRGRSSATVVCRHPTHPGSPDSTGLWRTRLIDPDSTAQLDANLTLRVADYATADALDPPFGAINTLPLARGNRTSVFTATNFRPATLTRLELSTLGGTLDAAESWDTFEWEHHAVLGRDMHVRLRSEGVLYPFGHRAQFLELTERTYDSAAGGAAVLRTIRVLTIVEPVRRAPGDTKIRRAFPFGDVEITRTVFTDLANPVRLTTSISGQSVGTHFWPTTLAGAKVLFPVSCSTSTGVVSIALPLLFVDDKSGVGIPTLTSPEVAKQLALDYPETEVRIPATDIDLVGGATSAVGVAAAAPKKGDIQEVRALTIAGVKVEEGLSLADGYRSKLTGLEVGLPALRSLLGEDARSRVKFAQKYLQNGAEDVLLEMVPVDIDFSEKADRSGGLVAPKFVTNAISRSMGPVDRFALPDPATGFIDPARLFPSDSATLLGFPLNKLLTQLKLPPQITATPIAGSAPEVQMQWRDVKLTSVGPFKAEPATKLDLTVTAAPNKAETTCVVNNFVLELPPGPKRVLRLSFATLRFTQRDGKSPQLDVEGVNAEFLGDLNLLKKLADAVDLGDAGKLLDVKPTGLAVRYSIPIPSISAGVFVMTNMAFTAGIEVPFNGDPLQVLIGFANRVNPFQLGVMMFGGGGYIELALGRDGLKRFEAALEFGAFVAVDFVIASGEVHALGGVRFVLERDGAVTVTGYLRVGGCVEVLGLISVSIELCLSLTYKSERNALVGRAVLVIEIDLTLWSDSVEIDSGEWEFAGGGPRALLGARAGTVKGDLEARWKEYREAFAPRIRDAAPVATASHRSTPGTESDDTQRTQ